MSQSPHHIGDRLGRVTILDGGFLSRFHPVDQTRLSRTKRWFLVECDCGAPSYWVNDDQMRSHRQCQACARKSRSKKPAAVVRLTDGVPDFARMRLVSR